MIAERPLVLDLCGPLSLRDGAGRELTPKARKAQGLLALLATSPGLRRSRAWLQDKLWSDRGPEQGAASLRQCLTELRRSLGEHSDCLRTEAGWVALDPERVTVRAVPPPGPGVGAEFLEGLDIRDPEFEHWLRDQRLAHDEQREAAREAGGGDASRAGGVVAGVAAGGAAGVAAGAAGGEPGRDAGRLAAALRRPLLVIAPAEATRDELRLFADILANDIGLRIGESGDALVTEAMPLDVVGRALGLRVSVRVAEIGASVYLQLRLAELAGGTIIWIGLRELEPGQPLAFAHGPIAQLCSEAVAVAVDELAGMADRASDEDRLALLGYQASRHTVLLDLDEQKVVDGMLARAFEQRPLGIFLARRALLRDTQLIERMAVPRESTAAEAIEMARKGLELAPTNATVVAAAAKVVINFEHKVHGGMELARKAVELGPTNPLAWQSLAVAHAHVGQAEEAHAAALRAREFSAHLPQTFLWDMLCCMTATVAGRYEEAIRFGECARELAPSFKPPLRYLAALYYRVGRTEAAAEQLRQLRRIEPDFSLSLLESEDYPASALRQTPLIRIAGSGLL